MKGCFIRMAVPPARIGLDGLPVWERGAEKRVAGMCGIDSSADVVELRIHVSVSAMMSD